MDPCGALRQDTVVAAERKGVRVSWDPTKAMGKPDGGLSAGHGSDNQDG